MTAERNTVPDYPHRTMRAMRTFLVVSVSVIYVPHWRAAAHPLCFYDNRSPDPEASMVFCPQEPEGACCTEEEENAAINVYKGASEEELTGDCADYYRQVACGPCNSYSAHLYERLNGRGPEDGMTMKQSFCDELVAACEGQIVFPTYEDETYCEKHVGGTADMLWSYPIAEEDKTFESSGLVEAFPDLDIPANVICMHMTPDGDYWWIGCQDGDIVKVEAADPTSSSMVLDISSGADLKRTFEEGLMDFAISPTFETTGYFYVSYTVELEEHHNRLSRFTYYDDDPVATKDSIVIILTTEEKDDPIHNAGWLGFSPADYDRPTATSHDLYWTTGDGGPQTDPFNNGQNLDNLLSALIRIRVFSGDGEDDIGYESPSGNMAGGRPELCAKGLRNPFRCAFDSATSDLYCGDVGQIRVEEIDLMTCGNNYGWPRFEGSRCQEAAETIFGDCEDASRSGFSFPIFQYCHPDYFWDEDAESDLTGGEDVCGTRAVAGNAVIVGHVYRGQRFSEVLAGALIFADAQRKNIFYLREEGGEWISGTIVSDQTAPVISFSEDLNGEQYVITSDGGIFQLPCGDLCSTTCLDQSDLEPTITESFGCFVDVPTDRALKVKRAPACDDGEDAMSPQICASYCATFDTATTFGVQFAYQCYCGNDDLAYDRHGSLPAESCATLCTSNPDFTCGGFNAIEVYSFEPGEADDTPIGSPAPVPQLPPTPSPVVVPTPSPLPLYSPFEYLGCFGDSRSSRTFTGPSISSDSMTTEVCAAFCSTSQFFGTEAGDECFCSRADDIYSIQGTSTCDAPCDGDSSQICGGNFALSVYVFDGVVPGTLEPVMVPTLAPVAGNYIGCFLDSPANRVLSGGVIKDPTMTIEFCESFCDGFGFYGTEFGTECFCGSPGSIDAMEATNCNMECGGDSSQVCGGRDAISLYALSTPSPVVVTSPKPSPTVTYIGCYQDSPNHLLPQKNVDADNMTNELCESLCQDYVYFGTQFSIECWCGNAPTYDNLGESGDCTMLCAGDANQYCGGFRAMNVYAITAAATPSPIPEVEAPKPTPTSTYLGCYEDNSRNRIMTESTVDLELTNEACSSICATFTYYGTQFENECWCSNAATYDSIGESTSCTMTCAGDPTQYCGGRNAMNVYENTNPLTPSPIPVTEAPQAPTSAPVVVVEPPMPTDTATYLGCFQDSSRNRVMTNVTSDLALTNELCASICASFMYYGTQYGSECWCSNAATYDSIGESTSCTFTCAGDPTQYCGGRYAMNVYENTNPLTPSPIPVTEAPQAPTPAPVVMVEPPMPTDTATYLGCYQDSSRNRVMTNVTSDLALTNECWCGNADTYDSIGESTDCTTVCAGDPTQYCGGRYAMNVYENNGPVTPAPSPQPTIVPVSVSGTDSPLSIPTPAPLQSTTATVTYLGCYGDSAGARAMTNKTVDLDLTIEGCASICSDFTYFGTQYSRECWCSNLANYDQHGESTGCTMPCEGDATQVCGGVYAMNVYQIGTRRRLVEAPIPSVTYIGCYEDSQERVVSKRSFHRTMTNEVCASECAGYSYFGTKRGVECWCSNTDSHTRLSESTDCTTECPGDSAQICGGSSVMSVHQHLYLHQQQQHQHHQQQQQHQ